MSQRYRKSVAAVMTSEPETSSPYGTRNKRRKLDEIDTHPPTISHRTKSFEQPQPPQIPRRVTDAVEPRHAPMYSRNLDKALKSILSESPRMRNPRGPAEVSGESVELTSSLDEEGSSSAVVAVRENGPTSSISMSSQSRETTPSSSMLGEPVVDVPPFIEFFQKERNGGKISKEVRDEAVKILKEWRSEWYAQDKRIRELKRKIKNFTPVAEVKARGRSLHIRTTTNGSDTHTAVETPKASTSVEPESEKQSESRSASSGRRASVTATGPNGLTGSYWDISIDDMGRGSRRKSKS
jgi:hypothetical protein